MLIITDSSITHTSDFTNNMSVHYPWKIWLSPSQFFDVFRFYSSLRSCYRRAALIIYRSFYPSFCRLSLIILPLLPLGTTRRGSGYSVNQLPTRASLVPEIRGNATRQTNPVALRDRLQLSQSLFNGNSRGLGSFNSSSRKLVLN